MANSSAHYLDPGGPAGVGENPLLTDAVAERVRRTYRVAGPLDVPALRAAWRELLDRHEILRGEEIGCSPVRCGEPDRGPLARLDIDVLGSGQHRVALTLDRVIVDEASMSVVMDELSALYRAARNGESGNAALLAPATQFRDYMQWRRTWMRSAEYGRRRAWWAAELTQSPPLRLPGCQARADASLSVAAAARFDWDKGSSRALVELAQAREMEPWMVLLAGFQTLLHRYGGASPVKVGALADGRLLPEFARTVGPCSYPVLFCVDFSAGPTFVELLGQVARVVDGAFAHRLLDGEVAAEQALEAMVVVRDQAAPDLRLAGARVSREPDEDGPQEAALALVIDRMEPTVCGALRYRRDRFGPQAAGSILDQLATLMRAAVTDPDCPVEALPMETPEVRDAAVRAADAFTAAARPELPVHEIVHIRAAQRPQDAAIAWAGDSLSYRDLAARATSIAGALRRLGRTGGGICGCAVAVRMSPGPSQVAAMLGILAAGGYVVCLGPGDQGERGRAILADSDARCLVLDAERPGDELVRWYRQERAGLVLHLAARDDAEAPPPATSGEMSRGAGQRPETQELRAPAYLMYTSGSTGSPKGVIGTHGGLTQFVTWMAEQFGIDRDARVAQWAAPGFDVGLCEIFATLTAGATLCSVPEEIRPDAEQMAKWLAAERITHFQTVPSFAREVVKSLASGGNTMPLPALRHLLLTGEALPAEMANGLRAVLPTTRLVNVYGPTESVAATWYELPGSDLGPVCEPVPIGRSIPGRQVLVVDDSDRTCPAGVIGEVVIRSPYIVPGYAGHASADTAPFRPLSVPGPSTSGHDPEPVVACYRTGDLGRRRWDGLLEFHGRRDLQIKFYGTRIELADIEATLTSHDSVTECAVVASTDRHGLVSRLTAYVVPRDPMRESDPDAFAPAASAAMWRAHLRRRYGNSAPPVSFTTLPSLPRTVRGKVDRHQLAEAATVPGAMTSPPEYINGSPGEEHEDG